MNPATEIGCVVERELSKNVRSAKGIVLFALSLLGGSSIALLMTKFGQFVSKSTENLPPDAVASLREEALTRFYDAPTAHALSTAPDLLLGLLPLTVGLTPMLVALMGFDAVAPDIQHRSIRYWSLRVRRPSYMIGKWLGLWATVSLVTLVMDGLIWGIGIARGEVAASTMLPWGVRFWLVTLPMSAVWCAAATFLSSLFRSPILALLLTCAAFFSLWVVYLIGAAKDFAPMLYIYPNHYEQLLLSPEPDKIFTALVACVAMTAVYVGAGALVLTRRDV